MRPANKTPSTHTISYEMRDLIHAEATTASATDAASPFRLGGVSSVAEDSPDVTAKVTLQGQYDAIIRMKHAELHAYLEAALLRLSSANGPGDMKARFDERGTEYLEKITKFLRR